MPRCVLPTQFFEVITKKNVFLDYLTDIVFLHTLSSLALLCDVEFAVVITK